MRAIIMISFLGLFNHGIMQGQEVKPEIYLTVNQGDEISMVRGMPVTLRVRLYYSLGLTREEFLMELPDSLLEDPELVAILDSLYTPFMLSKPASSWHQSVMLQFETDQRKKFRVVQHLLRPRPPETHLLYPDVSQQVIYGIDPDQTIRWKPGKIRIRAGIPLPGGDDTLWSGFARLEVQKTQLKKMKEASRDQLIELGNYYSVRDACQQADEAAKFLSRIDSTSFEYFTLKGDVSACKGEHQEAQQWYYKALIHVPKPAKGHAEEPFILHIRIQEQTEKLNRP